MPALIWETREGPVRQRYFRGGHEVNLGSSEITSSVFSEMEARSLAESKQVRLVRKEFKVSKNGC